MTNTPSVIDIIKLLGGPSATARIVGCRPHSVMKWKRKGYIPVERVPAIARAAGLPLHLIRPDRPDLFPPTPQVAA